MNFQISAEALLQTLLIVGAIVTVYVKLSVRLAKLQVKVNHMWSLYSDAETEQGEL
jgi:hypothetical protein